VDQQGERGLQPGVIGEAEGLDEVRVGLLVGGVELEFEGVGQFARGVAWVQAGDGGVLPVGVQQRRLKGVLPEAGRAVALVGVA